MNVTCPACDARYRIDDAKVRGRTARMRCKSCTTEWMVSGDAAAAEAAAAPKEPARAAVVKKGKERERRDLFATQMPDESPVSSSRPSRPAPSYGARNENSVLFTVDSLKAAAKASTPPPPPVADAPAWTAANIAPSAPPSAMVVEDNEGIIDLKALSVLPPRAMPSVFPGEPSSGFARAVEAAKSGGDPAFVAHVKGLVKTANPRVAGIAAAGLAAVVLMGIGVSAVFSGDIAHKLARAESQARVSTVAAKVAVGLEEAVKAKAALASMPTPDASKPATSVKPAGLRTHHASYAPRTTSTQTAAFSPKPKKATDTCGCHGDFNCILRCSAKGK